MHRPGPGDRGCDRTPVERRPQDIVAAGYDTGADAFAEWKAQIRGLSSATRARELLALLPERPDVLELCCGAGTAETAFLAAAGQLVAVDISAEQLRRARERVPDGDFVHADVTQASFPPESFDAVASFYALNHVPREELGRLLARIAGWLRPRGYLLATFGASDLPGWRGEWLDGIETFFSGYTPERTLEIVGAAGLALVSQELETIHEPEGDATFLWALAQRPE